MLRKRNTLSPWQSESVNLEDLFLRRAYSEWHDGEKWSNNFVKWSWTMWSKLPKGIRLCSHHKTWWPKRRHVFWPDSHITIWTFYSHTFALLYLRFALWWLHFNLLRGIVKSSELKPLFALAGFLIVAKVIYRLFIQWRSLNKKEIDYLSTNAVLPRLVRRRTIKLMSFFDKKKPSNFEQFLEVFVIFE